MNWRVRLDLALLLCALGAISPMVMAGLFGPTLLMIIAPIVLIGIGCLLIRSV